MLDRTGHNASHNKPITHCHARQADAGSSGVSSTTGDRFFQPRTLSLVLVLAVFCAACSGQRYYGESEDALATSGYYHILDHISTYYPSGVALNFPGYIVGFEESPRRLVSRDASEVVIDESAFSAGFTVRRLARTLRFDLPYVSQVIRYHGRPYGEGNCALYNLYHNNGTAAVENCPGEVANAQAPGYDYRAAFNDSWDALDRLRRQVEIEAESGDYTHLVVAVMGLDTPQETAMRNYRSLVSSIRRNGGESFKPLFIGITWPSFFANRWFNPMWETFAYSTIADRADTLGLTWLGIFFDQVVLPLGASIDTVVIGHSFGARAASMALCVGPLIVRPPNLPPLRSNAGSVGTFIGIAPAFSLQRFVGYNGIFYEHIHYREHCPKIDRAVFTASANDNAFAPVFWSDSAGEFNTMQKACRQQAPLPFACTAADADGDGAELDPAHRFSYIDTSQLMKYVMPEAKGTGHSDIYRPQVGRLLWGIIDGAQRQ